MKRQAGFSIIEMCIAAMIGVGVTLAIGVSINQMAKQQKDVTIVASNETGWGEVVAHLLKNDSALLLVGTISSPLRACLDGVGINCQAQAVTQGTPVDLSILKITPFFGDKSGCAAASAVCTMERRLEKTVICSSAQSCNILFRLSLYDQGKLVKSQNFPLSMSAATVGALDFASCPQKPVGVDYQTGKILCANNINVDCKDLSVVGAGQGQCGVRKDNTEKSTCNLQMNGRKLEYNFESPEPARLSVRCKFDGGKYPDISGVLYTSGQASNSGIDLSSMNGHSGWTMTCSGTILNTKMEALNSCDTWYEDTSGSSHGHNGGGGPPSSGSSGSGSGHGGSSMGNSGSSASVSGTGSSFTSYLGALGGL